MGLPAFQPLKQAHRPRWLVSALSSSLTSSPILSRPLVAVAVVGALSGCSGVGPAAAPAPSATPSVVPRPAATLALPLDSKAQLLKQYEAFWSSLSSISRRPASQRRTALAKITMDPELKSAVEDLAGLDAKGQVLYGSNLPRPNPKIAPDGLTAVVDDCQNSTMAGVANATTMARISAGVPRNHVVVTSKKSDGTWKIAFVAYTRTPC